MWTPKALGTVRKKPIKYLKVLNRSGQQNSHRIPADHTGWFHQPASPCPCSQPRLNSSSASSARPNPAMNQQTFHAPEPAQSARIIRERLLSNTTSESGWKSQSVYSCYIQRCEDWSWWNFTTGLERKTSLLSEKKFCEAGSILFLTNWLKFSYIQYLQLEAEPHFSSVASQEEHTI